LKVQLDALQKVLTTDVPAFNQEVTRLGFMAVAAK